MKLEYKTEIQTTLSSVQVKRIHRPYNGSDWHFHKEFELIYFMDGQGTRIVGDSISTFNKGELVLVGHELPHLWKNEEDYNNQKKVDFIVLKFTEKFGDIDIFSVPELANIKKILNKARYGIQFSKSVLPKIHELMIQISVEDISDNFISFLRILHILSMDEDCKIISSLNFSLPRQIKGENRLQKVIYYISNNYDHRITLEEISNIALMTPPAFCRFFKIRTNKTFSQFLNEIRISKACQLLIKDRTSVEKICYDVGFNSLTNFNRMFKGVTGMPPSVFRDNHF